MNFYRWDHNDIFFDVVNVDDSSGSLPMRSTPTEPPKLTGTQVARWTGSGWEKLAAAPEPEPAPAPDWPALIAARRWLAETSGTLPTHGPLFVTLLIGVVLLVGLLNYVPALALGPVVEHFQLWAGH